MESVWDTWEPITADHWKFENIYSPNDRFLVKFFIKIISLDSSQKVPPHEPKSPIHNNQASPY